MVECENVRIVMGLEDYCFLRAQWVVLCTEGRLFIEGE